MTKKITSITINNFKGYYGEYDPIIMCNGENLLIYGENGSGKSSLYKALNNFFASSRDALILYTKNRYLIEKTGSIKIEFSDYDCEKKEILDGTDTAFVFSDKYSNHQELFIQNTALVKGFLDYTDLLKVYFHKEADPNLFDLIVLNLLGEHIPHKTGGNFRFKEKWIQIQKELFTKAYTRNDRCHKSAKDFLPIFEIHLRGTLDEVFIILNKYLFEYFNDLKIQLDYFLAPINLNYGNNKWEWNTTTIFKLLVIKDGIQIDGGYNDFLNEARLSAIAISLYLASLRISPATIDFKILFLDDVFIGLDAGNRIPILNILRKEFSDYQKFISTYDRHWFELAKKHFEINCSERWKSIEMYVGFDFDSASKNKIDKPIIVEGYSHYDRALRYLNHRSNPDYPAAVNYLRKAFEKLLTERLPFYLAVDNDMVRIPDYKLSILLNNLHYIFKNIGLDMTQIDLVKGLLHILLHPLSHYEITAPVYKQEIKMISHAYLELNRQIDSIDFNSNFKCILESKCRLKISFSISTNHIQYYEIILMEPLVFIVTNNGLINVKCYTYRYGGNKDGRILGPFTPSKKNNDFKYISIEEAVNKIYYHITHNEGVVFSKPTNYLSIIEYFDKESWNPILNLMK